MTKETHLVPFADQVHGGSIGVFVALTAFRAIEIRTNRRNEEQQQQNNG